jgi:hypothetical protein
MRLAVAILMVALGMPSFLAARNQVSRNEQAHAQGKTATVTGCLARGVEPKTYVLTNVAWSPTPTDPGHDQRPQAVPAPDRPATAETLRLAGAAATLQLEKHVGHTVSATGVLARTDPAVTPGIVVPDPQPQGDTTSRTRATEEQAASMLRTFDLRSLTDVAAECR